MRRKVARKLGLNSIQGRLTAIAFFFIIATALTMGVVGFRFTVNFESERFREHFALLASYLASNAELGVLLGNEKILEGLTDNMLKVSDVQSIEILGRDGDVIMRRAHENPAPELGIASAPVMSRSIGAGDTLFFEGGETEEELGEVTIAYSLAGLAQLKKDLAARYVAISLLLAIAPVFMYWTLSRAIGAPLKNLLQVAAQVSRGRMEVRADGGRLLETRTLAHALNEMLDAIESQRRELGAAHAAMSRQQVLAEVGKFSMIVAHEIKNPLAIIKGSLDIAAKEGPAEIKAQMMGFADEEVARINKLIEDFLVFAKPQTPDFQPVPIAGLVEGLIRRIRIMSPATHIEMQIPAPRPGAELRCDVSLVERALLNIVRNALEASPLGRPILLQVACTQTSLQFAVKDDGPGIDPEGLSSIFEPFFSTKAKGTGLGLGIAKDVVQAHGGTITAENLPGGGACFTLDFPLSS